MTKILLMSGLIAAATALPAWAAERCSIHPAKGMSDSQLSGLAKISQAEAEQIAIAQLKSEAVTSSSAELESEHGCLIWSFDLHVAGKSGVQEIQVDAGNGKVLSVKHESVQQEATELSKETTVAPKK